MGVFNSKEHNHVLKLIKEQIISPSSQYKPKYHAKVLGEFLKTLSSSNIAEREKVIKRAIERNEVNSESYGCLNLAVLTAKMHPDVSIQFLAEYFREIWKGEHYKMPIIIDEEGEHVTSSPALKTVAGQWTDKKGTMSKLAELLSSQGQHNAAHTIYEAKKEFDSSLRELVSDRIKRAKGLLDKRIMESASYEDKASYQEEYRDIDRNAVYINELAEKYGKKMSKKRTRFITAKVYDSIQKFLFGLHPSNKQSMEIKFKVLESFLNRYDKLFSDRGKTDFYITLQKGIAGLPKNPKNAMDAPDNLMSELDKCLQKAPYNSEAVSGLLAIMERYFVEKPEPKTKG